MAEIRADTRLSRHGHIVADAPGRGAALVSVARRSYRILVGGAFGAVREPACGGYAGVRWFRRVVAQLAEHRSPKPGPGFKSSDPAERDLSPPRRPSGLIPPAMAGPTEVRVSEDDDAQSSDAPRRGEQQGAADDGGTSLGRGEVEAASGAGRRRQSTQGRWQGGQQAGQKEGQADPG